MRDDLERRVAEFEEERGALIGAATWWRDYAMSGRQPESPYPDFSRFKSIPFPPALDQTEARVAALTAERDDLAERVESLAGVVRESIPRAEAAERARDEAWAALEEIARHHHDTLTPSRLHDPEHIDWENCHALTCARARAVLAARDVASEKVPDGPRDLEGE